MGKINDVKVNSTEIVVVLDRSGSMSSIKKATIDGFNEFLQGQRAVEGVCKLTLVQFDNNYEEVYKDKDILAAEPLTDATYTPRGSTALLDAIGNAIIDRKDKIRRMDADMRPTKVVFVIITDGEENASTGFTGSQIKEMIQHQEDVEKWDFMFLGANQDAVVTARMYGITPGKAMSYGFTGQATQAAFSSVSANLATYRKDTDLSKRGTDFEFFSNVDRAIQKGHGAVDSKLDSK